MCIVLKSLEIRFAKIPHDCVVFDFFRLAYLEYASLTKSKAALSCEIFTKSLSCLNW